jgi:hypothetical protein
MKRLRGCAISIIRTTPNGDEDQLLIPMFRASRMPGWATRQGTRKSKKARTEGGESIVPAKDNEPCGFEVGPDFFNDVVRYHVPVPQILIKLFLRKPKLFDLVIWLSWRVYAAKRVSFIPLSELRQQIGSVDSNEGRLLADLRHVIGVAREVGWTQLDAEVISRSRGKKAAKGANVSGLRIAPPRDGVQFFQSTPKRVQAVQSPSDPEEVRSVVEKSMGTLLG